MHTKSIKLLEMQVVRLKDCIVQLKRDNGIAKSFSRKDQFQKELVSKGRELKELEISIGVLKELSC
jgi:hypothetical protein